MRLPLIKLAAVLPQGSEDRRALLRLAQDFATPEALKKYLKEHPGADPKNHQVKKTDEGEGKKDKEDKGVLRDEKEFADTTKASDGDLKQFQDHPAVKALGGSFKLNVIAGEDGEVSRGDLSRAIHVAEQLQKGIDKATDFCNLRPPACEGNLGITRDNMPQIMDKSVKDLLASDDPKDVKKGEAAVAAGADPKSDKTTQEQWFDKLKSEGTEITDDSIEVGKLIASQAEIKAGKSYGIAKAFLTGEFDKLPDLPILVARDPKTGKATVIDGHHRYAGLLLADPHRKMKVKVIEAPIEEALAAAFDLPGVFRADLQDNIVDENQPLDLARKAGSTWQQKGKWYAKNPEGKAGGPYKGKDAAEKYAKGGKADKKSSLVRLASVLPKGSPERRTLLRLARSQ
jgi:hypothetical protein